MCGHYGRRMVKDPAVRNVALLAACQALGMSCLSLSMTISALVGNSLASEPKFATFPLALQFVGTAASTVPASFFMKRYGRRSGFSLGAVLGILGGLISAWAVFRGDFELFCLGSILLGGLAAHVAYFRFAAADTASDAFRSRAISLVLAGGLVSAFLGPELAKHTRDLTAPVLFAGGYLSIAVLAGMVLILLQFIRIPRLAVAAARASGRPLGELLRQPTLIVAVLCAMVGYGSMNLVMVATPLAMVACNHPFESAAFVIQWHVVGMYAPSFFTGSLIHRFGNIPILAAGTFLALACVAINLSGVEELQFWSALVLLGLGWNFLFIGGTTLLTTCYRNEEKAKVQAFNDFMVFGTTAVTAFSSGALYNQFGWPAVNLGVVPALILVLGAVLWLGRRRAMAAV